MSMQHYRILRLDEVDSTNRYALKHLRSLNDRQIIIAERQTGGHGRFHREWFSPACGNLYMSVVLKPALKPSELQRLAGLTQYMSIVLCDILLQYNVEAEIKWPNDVLVDNEKIAGILGEGKFHGERFDGYVLGTGVNLSMTRADLELIDQPATSLNLLTGKPIEGDVFLDRLLKRFFAGYVEYLRGGFASIRNAYVERACILGKRVVVGAIEQSHVGTVRDFDSNGALVLEEDGEGEIVVQAGDVQFLRNG